MMINDNDYIDKYQVPKCVQSSCNARKEADIPHIE